MERKAVAIGTSAGGLELLYFLLPAIPANTQYSFLIVQHIRADSDSTFVEVLNSKCKIPVRLACSGQNIHNGRIYFAPPNYHLLVEPDLTLTLTTDARYNYSRPSIDILFETAAEAYGEFLTGIILTGANKDGSNGIKVVKEFGGKVIIQDPSDAHMPQMPKEALKQVKPDLLLNRHEIAEFLSAL